MRIDKRTWSWYGSVGVLSGIVILLAFFSGFLIEKRSVHIEPRTIRVEEGDSIFSIASKLHDQDVISSRVAFVGYGIASGLYRSIHPGIYQITSIRPQDILSLISSPPQEKEIVIVPGMSVSDIDTLLKREGIISEGSLSDVNIKELFASTPSLTSLESIEGFIAPDTYRFYTGRSAEHIASLLVHHFWEEYELLFEGYSFDEIYQSVIVASLLEKEVVSQEDKELVAGIIYKRYAVGMPLQIDASVLYGACGGSFVSCTPQRSMFEEDTPYNTYTRGGFPPTPIASPSLSSLQAALSPKSSAYWFYLSSPDRETHFSRTLDEHSYKRRVYLGL